MMASEFSMLLITGLDLPIVAASDFKNAGYYALATMVSNMLVVPFGAILLTIVPMMSSMSAGEPAERMGRAVLRADEAGNRITPGRHDTSDVRDAASPSHLGWAKLRGTHGSFRRDSGGGPGSATHPDAVHRDRLQRWGTGPYAGFPDSKGLSTWVAV